MEELPKYLAGIVVLIVTIYTAIKNQQQKTAIQPKRTASQPHTVSSNLDQVFEIERERNVLIQKQDGVHPKNKSIDDAKPVAIENSSSFIIKEREEEFEYEDLQEDFDARKAIIYSEILKPPYL